MSRVAGRHKNAKGIRGLEQVPKGSFWAGGGVGWLLAISGWTSKVSS